MALFASLALEPSLAQQPSIPQTFITTRAGVIVDVVVRDRRGQPLHDLSASDFEVREEGVEQEIVSVDLVNRKESGPPADALGPSSLHSGQMSGAVDRRVLAFALHISDPSGRRLAEKAATQAVKDLLRSHDYSGVFQVDRVLRRLVDYTNDSEAILTALKSAAGYQNFGLQRSGAVPGAEFGSHEPGQPAAARRDSIPYVTGHATLDALEELIETLKPFPGRKAVLFFSDGLALMPPSDVGLGGGQAPSRDSWLADNRWSHFRQVVERAADAHVAFYTFDTAGLRIETPLAEKLCFGCAPYVGLQMLATETGGAFVESTNDLAPAVGKALADSGCYYLIGYSPTRSGSTGEFRRIEVKVRRKGTTVLHRAGYLAREP